MQNNISTSATFNAEDPATKSHIDDLNSGWKMRLYFLKKLPTALWWGTKVKSCSPYRTEVELPYTWRTQNPFKSIYFAAQAGAAELSTGLMATIALRGRGKISMLVTDLQMEFMKKADQTVIFTCDEGIKLIEAVQLAIDTGEGVQATVHSVGRLPNGAEVSRMKITWSFKKKTR